MSIITTYYESDLAAIVDTPLTISNLEFYFDASVGITKDGANSTSAWDDVKSGNGHTSIQNTGGRQPLHTASDGEVNNEASLTFDGGDSLNINSGTIVFGPSFSIYSVYKVDVGVSFLTSLCGSNDGGDFQIFTGTTFKLGLQSVTVIKLRGDTLFTGFSYTAFLPGNIYRNGAEISYIVQNTATSFKVEGIGFMSSGQANQWEGKIMALIGYNKILSASDRSALDSWAQTRFGL